MKLVLTQRLLIITESNLQNDFPVPATRSTAFLRAANKTSQTMRTFFRERIAVSFVRGSKLKHSLAGYLVEQTALARPVWSIMCPRSARFFNENAGARVAGRRTLFAKML